VTVTHPNAFEYLDSLGIDAMKSMRPSLHRIEALCEALDHPERSVPAVHITGTNGKTSIARIVTALLSASGLTVGTYTSPHLVSPTERIALAGAPLGRDAFERVFAHLWPYLQLVEEEVGERLTYFEVMTALYLLWAVEQPVDVSVIEVGLGGAWDATNVVEAPVAVISKVALDHTHLLGEDPQKIAQEKAGIIKPGAAVVTGERMPRILEIISEAAGAAGASLSVIDRDFAVTDNRPAVGGRYVSVRTSVETYDEVFLALHGSHQGINAAVALEAVTRLLPLRPLERDVVEEAFASVRIPGRLEAVRPPAGKGPTVVFDVAHNPDGASTMVKGLSETFPFGRVVFVIGVVADKDYRGILAELGRVPCRLIVTEVGGPRAFPAEELQAGARELGLEVEMSASAAEATRHAIRLAASDELVCVTGSHYVVGEARAALESDGYAAASVQDANAPAVEGS
jgi:dihydrofolate synthase/folylpolyglutamate synthase